MRIDEKPVGGIYWTFPTLVPLFSLFVCFILLSACAALNSSQLVDIALKKQNVAEFYLNQGDGATALILFKEAKDQWAKVDFVPGESSGWWIEANIERCETVIDELERELDNYLPKGI